MSGLNKKLSVPIVADSGAMYQGEGAQDYFS